MGKQKNKNPYLPVDVNVDGTTYKSDSPEYKDIYKSLLPMSDGAGGNLPTSVSSETAEVVGKAPDWLKNKRENEAAYKYLSSPEGERSMYRNLGANIAKPVFAIGNAAAEMTGVPGAVRFGQNPYENLKGTMNVLSDLSSPGGYMAMFGGGYSSDEEYQQAFNTLDAAGLAAGGIGMAKGAFGAGKNVVKQADAIINATDPNWIKYVSQEDKVNRMLSKKDLVKKATESYAQTKKNDLIKSSLPENNFGGLSLNKDSPGMSYEQFLENTKNYSTKRKDEYAGSLDNLGKAGFGSYWGISDDFYKNIDELDHISGKHKYTITGSDTKRVKAIENNILNHEVDHYLYKQNIDENADLLEAFDTKKFGDSKRYLVGRSSNIAGDEIRARMSQLMDYFEFKVNPKTGIVHDIFGNKEFTKKHLEYAMKNYSNDVIDNNMTPFFNGIKDKDLFVKKMNNRALTITGAAATGAALGSQEAQGPSYRNGGPVDPLTPEEKEAAMRGMMKARIAIDSHFGNPAAKRLTEPYVNPYIFNGNEKDYGTDLGVPAGETGTHFMASMGKYAVPFIQQNKNGGLYFNEYASPSDKEAMKFETEKEAEYFADENYKKVAPLMKNWGKYAKGGNVKMSNSKVNCECGWSWEMSDGGSDPYKCHKCGNDNSYKETIDKKQYEKGGEAETSTVEIERNERVYTPNGKMIMETPSNAPTHEQGGVKVTLPNGSLVFPKKYFNALDAVSGLPGFKKITDTMLDNAEKAYLRGEAYSSGGKRK